MAEGLPQGEKNDAGVERNGPPLTHSLADKLKAVTAGPVAEQNTTTNPLATPEVPPPENLPSEDAEEKLPAVPDAYKFPERMRMLDEYSLIDDPRPLPPDLRGLPATNPEVRAEIEKRTAEWLAWKAKGSPEGKSINTGLSGDAMEAARRAAAEKQPQEDNLVYTQEDPRSALEQEGEVVKPKTPEKQRAEEEKLQKVREMLYCMTTGKKTAEDMPKDYAPGEAVMREAGVVYDRKGKLVDYFEKEVKAENLIKKSKGKEGRAQLAEAVIWTENAEKSFEKSMDGLKVEMLKDFLAKKKAEFPDLTKKELEEEAVKFSSTFVIEAATNMYIRVDEEKMERALSAEERGRIRRMMESYAKMSRGKRILLSAAIGAGAAAAIAVTLGTGGVVAATTIAGVRGGRSLLGGGIGAGLQAIVEKVTGRKYGKEREEKRKAQYKETGATLSAETQKELEDGKEWLNNQEKLLALMHIVDTDAKKYKREIDKINAKEQKTKRRSAIVTGLIGGALANIDNIAHLFEYAGGPKVGAEVAAPAVVPPEHLAEAADKMAGMHPVTIGRGESLWTATNEFVRGGQLSKEQWLDAWQHSTVDLKVGGVTKSFSISEVGLVHPGDQVDFVVDAAGNTRFVVQDFPHDVFNMGDDVAFYNALQGAGKPIPSWLEHAVEIKQGVRAPVEHAAAVLHHSQVSAEAIPAISESDVIYNAVDRAQVEDAFKSWSLLDQEKTLDNVAGQTQELKDMTWAGFDQRHVDFGLANYRNAEALHSALALSPEYLANIQELRHSLSIHQVSPQFFEQAGSLKVRDLLRLGTGRGVSTFGRMYPALQHLSFGQRLQLRNLTTMVMEQYPGRIEQNMSVAEFIKSSIRGGA